MKLIKVDKRRYRKHLNYLIIACIAALLIGSLGISQTLIALYPDESGSHFHWNLTGVVITSAIVGFALNKIKHHDFMTEVYYVWRLKQVLNKIHRKMMKLKSAADSGDVVAMTAIQYSYAGSRLLWELDDNTIIMDQLALDQAALNTLAEKHHIKLDIETFSLDSLKTF
ncbi:DUF3087 domain-containing protein [Glaciecola sp. MH2013]|uniref:DUF3087 domain-containing protein n=1 Tax=Glaciecola sp. MH2013 TaxID=2785524 RepID=UPI00189EB62A|nr:DUF3087 domain-containing protein [Glaciecola sp. MH2013]MBF7073563.1 DUF3087 domain-containing protein [Glaciecola sp. MH2013]